MVLYLVATPIGNLSDISLRCIEILKKVDYILCEDTRHSLTLLKHYSIQKPLKSYHKFSEVSKCSEVIEDLQSGKEIALISDAGTPGISDPGEILVKACVEAGLTVSAIPGPCAAIAALTCSGLATERFQFVGFLPKKKGELQKALQEILTYPGTTICYESPQRVLDTLELLQTLAPEREIVIARELTKKFEEVRRGYAKELLAYWEEKNIKGEIVLLIAGKTASQINWETLSPQEHVQTLQEMYGLSKKEAIKMASEIRGVPKRTIYNQNI